MFDKKSIYFDVWRSLNENLFKAYADCYFELSNNNHLNPKVQLGKSLEKFDSLLSYEPERNTYKSAYTIARELAIFGINKNGDYFVNPLIELFQKGKLSYQDYLINFFLRWEVVIQGKVTHPLYEFINRFEGVDRVNSESLKELDTIYSSSENDHHLSTFLHRLNEANIIQKLNRTEYKLQQNINALKQYITKTIEDVDYYRSHIVRESGNYILKYYSRPNYYTFDNELNATPHAFGDAMSIETLNKNEKLFPTFSILGGISGTGKSRFVKSQALFSNNLNEDSIEIVSNYSLIPVKPDWHDPSDLIGYVSRIGENKNYVFTDFFRYMCKIWINHYASGGAFDAPNKKLMPYWLCLDEMNLAPVEQYFSDFLSVNESKKWKSEQYYCDSIVSKSIIQELAKEYWLEIFKSDYDITHNWVLSRDSFSHYLGQSVKEGTVKKYLESLNRLYQAFVSPETCKFEISPEIRSHLDDVQSEFQIGKDFYETDPTDLKKIMENFILENRSKNKLSQWASKTSEATGDGSLSAVSAKLIEYLDLIGDSSSDSYIEKFVQDFYENGLPIPPNLMVVGTVNMDETTHSFSRKVLDRAFSIDFSQFFPNNFDALFGNDQITIKPLSYPSLTHLIQIEDLNLRKYQGVKFSSDNLSVLITAKDFLKSLNEKVLNSTPFEVGYRALDQLLLMVEYWYEGDANSLSTDEDKKWLASVFDEFIMTKILPRIEGDMDKLAVDDHEGESNILIVLLNFLTNHEVFQVITDKESTRFDFFREDGDKPIQISCRSIDKVKWMNRRLEKSGYTNFWV